MTVYLPYWRRGNYESSIIKLYSYRGELLSQERVRWQGRFNQVQANSIAEGVGIEGEANQAVVLKQVKNLGIIGQTVSDGINIEFRRR